MLLVPNVVPFAHASGLVYINPPTISVQPKGTSFAAQVQVAGIDPFNGWDIQITSDPSVINATSLTINGNMFDANYSSTQYPSFEQYHCINGAGKCAPNDGHGIVHSAVVYLGPLRQSGPSDGLLFNVTYKVVGSGSYSPIHFQKIIITNGTPTPVTTDSPQDGLYGILPGQGFKLTASPNATSIPIGSSANITLTVSGFGGYSALVNLSFTVPQRGLSLFLNVTSVSLLPSQPSHAKLTVAADIHYNQTIIPITVTAASSGLTQSVTVSITTLAQPDFILGVLPSLLKIHATSSGSAIITLDTQSGFSGSIHLKMDVPRVAGLSASLGATDFVISPGQPATTVLGVSTPSSDLPFKYLINITASSQSSTHMPFTITVKPPSPDFTFQIGGSGFIVQAGQSRAYTLNMTSVDYFKGQLFLLATSLSGIKEVFTRPSVALDFGNSSTSIMTITTDAYLAPGNHVVNMTALGTTFLGMSVNHTITTTITVISIPGAKVILGLQPLTYFGIVGALWIGVVGAAIREIRKTKAKRFLS